VICVRGCISHKMKKIQYHKKEIENNLRWQFMKNAFDGIVTPDAFLIGHAFLLPSTTISPKLWKNFSQFCNLCDTIAYLRNKGLDRESCLSLWMSYKG